MQGELTSLEVSSIKPIVIGEVVPYGVVKLVAKLLKSLSACINQQLYHIPGKEVAPPGVW